MSNNGKPWPAFLGDIEPPMPDVIISDEAGDVSLIALALVNDGEVTKAEYREVYFPPIGLTKRQKRSIPKLP